MDEMLPLLRAAGIDTTFWFTFAHYTCPSRRSRRDSYVASYGIVVMMKRAPPASLMAVRSERFTRSRRTTPAQESRTRDGAT